MLRHTDQVPDAFRHVPVSTLLKQVAHARAAGDWRTARPQWEACIARAKPRVEMVVDRYVAKGWIRPADRDDVVQNALIRAHRKLVENLDSLEEHVFFAAVIKAADFQCRDDARKDLKRRQRSAHEDAAEAAESRQRWDREEEIRAANELVDDLMRRLPNDRQRRFVALQRLGTSDADIAADLGVTMDNLYQIRSRTLKALGGLIDR
jgi:RNA polymerase sigma factor (sigma-70 family)